MQAGIFTITPAFAIILPNGHQVITIECAPEQAGKFEEQLCFDITDRNINLYPNGIIYNLTAEAAHPAINNSLDIFEEHTIIPNITAIDPRMMGIGIYTEDENRFIFNNVIVGRTAKARFKLANTNKIPIDISILLKTSSKSTKTYNETTFEVEPQRVQIGPHSCAYATISFNPMAMQNYNAYFEATLENMPVTAKHRAIAFEVTGDGNLPRFTIQKPTLRNKKGQCLMLFKRTVVNKSDVQQLVLGNDGTLPAKINFYLYDPDQAFKFKPLKEYNYDNGIVFNASNDTVSSVVIQPNTQIGFSVICEPTAIQTYQGSLQLSVTDNQFEDTIIQMVGEGKMNRRIGFFYNK